MAVAPHKLEHVSISHNILIAVVTKIDTWANPGGQSGHGPHGKLGWARISGYGLSPFAKKLQASGGITPPPPVNRPNKYILCIYLAATIHLTIN